ncbi:MAG: MGMT family protein [Labilithrix sp.]|nr:MGMT family protein [Labilithrix sp.]
MASKTKRKTSARRRRPSASPARPSSAETTRGPFARVWAIVKRIPRGRVATYGQLAEMIEHRLSPVGIGWAIRAAGEGSIPWHRVINSKGTISTDGEHPGLQRAMLESEGVVFDAEGRVDLETARWRPRR